MLWTFNGQQYYFPPLPSAASAWRLPKIVGIGSVIARVTGSIDTLERDILRLPATGLSLVVGAKAQGRVNVVKVLAHVLAQVFINVCFVLVVPVGIVVDKERTALDKPFTHLAGVQQQPVLVHDISVPSRVHPHPFLQRVAPCHTDDMAVVILGIVLGHTNEVTCRNAYRLVHFAEHDGHEPAVVTALLALSQRIKVGRIVGSFRPIAAAVVPYVVVQPGHDALHAVDVAALACYAVNLEQASRAL